MIGRSCHAFYAQRTGKLFDPYHGSELFQGSLMVAVLWSFWGSVVRDASATSQRYAVDVHIAGVTVDNRDSTGGPPLALNPAALLQLQGKSRWQPTDRTMGAGRRSFSTGRCNRGI